VLVAGAPTNTWRRVEAVGTIPAGTAFVKAAAVWRNVAGTAGTVYFDDLQLQAYVPQNLNKIAFIGSSVLTGVGATNNRGYTTLYSELLTRRATAGTGGPWVTTNLGVPGNNTVDVLNRFENDVLPTNSKYVLVGLVLGNEGIIGGGQPIFDQFRTNMQAIVNLARVDGLTPVVALGYGRNDYTATEYAFVRRMNLLLHGWSVPTVNLLGGVDDGNGRYAPGYWWDALHPNDLGHSELQYTVVPSLFDALNANKALPRRKASNGITLTKANGVATNIVRLVPEEVVHPFTQAIRFKTAGAGQLVEIRDSAGIAAGTLSVSSGGVVTYQSAKGRTITGTVAVANNRWHKLVLTHYYARGATMLYVDSVKEGTVQERLRPTQFNLGGTAAPARVQFRDWMFWRAGMNHDEILAVAADSLLKGSLEMYAPLDGRRVATTDSLANLAQSTNTLARVSGPLAVRESAFAAQISLYPNPTTGFISLAGPVALDGTPVTVFDVLGKAVLTTRLRGSQLDLRALAPGVYTLVLDTRSGLVHKRLVRQE
jgi:hypothetical protein